MVPCRGPFRIANEPFFNRIQANQDPARSLLQVLSHPPGRLRWPPHLRPTRGTAAQGGHPRHAPVRAARGGASQNHCGGRPTYCRRMWTAGGQTQVSRLAVARHACLSRRETAQACPSWTFPPDMSCHRVRAVQRRLHCCRQPAAEQGTDRGHAALSKGQGAGAPHPPNAHPTRCRTSGPPDPFA